LSTLVDYIGIVGVLLLFAVPTYFIGKSARKNWQPKTQETPGSDLVGFPVTPAGGPLVSAPQGEPVSDEMRSAVLDRAIVMCASRGGRVEYRSPFQAIIVYGKPVNHILHAILSIVTCIWLIVWLIVAQSGGERREVLDVDPYGNLHTSRALNLGPTGAPGQPLR
jgi:hypothetical protein